MNNLIKIGDIVINQDANGRYCLNDLHRAAGGENKHRPSIWLQNKQTKSLIFELEVAGIPATHTIENVGTFVQKELVYAYGMWVSAVFYLHVIRTYDDFVMGEHEKLEIAQEKLNRSTTKDKNCLSVVIKERRNNAAHAVYKILERFGLVKITPVLITSYKKEITPAGWDYFSGYSKDGVIRVKPEMHTELISMVNKAQDQHNTELFN